MSEVMDRAQAQALADLLEAEAHWQRLPAVMAPEDPRSAVRGLHAKQKAYDAYHGKLLAYNARFHPAHVSEMLVGTPLRLALWCRKLRDLYRWLDPGAPCPEHLLAKARQFADRLKTRRNLEPFTRTNATDIQGAIRELEATADWCDGLVGP